MRCYPTLQAALIVTIVFGSLPAFSQGLHIETLSNGTQLVVVAQPLADATSAAWPMTDETGERRIETTTSGSLTMAADLSTALELEEDALAPSVVTIVSPESVKDLRTLLERILADHPAETPPPAEPPEADDGGIERRLGRPGDDAIIRLEITLPSAADPRRAAVEVVFELIGNLVSDQLPGLQARIQETTGILEVRTDPGLVQMSLSRLRVALDRLSANPDLEAGAVERARRRLSVRRLALLDSHPAGTVRLARQYESGGVEAVRQFLFGIDSVTLERVKEAAISWLPQHPGRTVLILPPQVFNPRFAPAPMAIQMDNYVSAAVLERPGSPLSSLCLRPVIVPDLDGDLSAVVLTRLASVLRQQEEAPGWIEVRSRPPSLELASPEGSFPELCEALSEALKIIAKDTTPVASEGGDARRRALRLLALRLGLDSGGSATAASLLQPGNLAIGAVAVDAEVAAEALQKFSVGGEAVENSPQVESLSSETRTRVAAAGSLSTLVLLLELDPTAGVQTITVLHGLLSQRLSLELATREIEILNPLIPGRRALVIVVTGEVDLEVLELGIRAQWDKVMAVVEEEEELTTLRRAAAATLASQRNGALGRARVCAAIAAGEQSWRSTRDLEMSALSVDVAQVNEALASWRSFDELVITGAGVMPVVEAAQ